jgi:hypothetical protein
MEFQLRPLDLAEYRHTSDVLASGNASELRKLAARCEQVLLSKTFAQRNSEEVRNRWAEACRLVHQYGEASGEFSEAAIALAAMPDFQASYYTKGHDTPISPALVYIGDDDGGLYGELRRDRWFEENFAQGFGARATEPAFGTEMAVFCGEDIDSLGAAAERVIRAAPTRVRHPEACMEAARRLLGLCRTASLLGCAVAASLVP